MCLIVFHALFLDACISKRKRKKGFKGKQKRGDIVTRTETPHNEGYPVYIIIWSTFVLCLWRYGLLTQCSESLHWTGNTEHSHPSHERATNHWAVEVAPGINPDELAASHGYVNLGPVGTLKNIYLFHKNANTRVVGVPHVPLHKSPHIKWAENQVSRKRFRRFELPTDPLFQNQWHLKNGAGVDINVLGAWQSGISGEGVTVAIVDDGLQRTHPDISPNYFAQGSYDFNENDPFPDPHAGDDHGTSAGGVTAAKNNNGVCGSGAAPNARLSGISSKFYTLRSCQTCKQYSILLVFTYQISLRLTPHGIMTCPSSRHLHTNHA